MSVVSTSVLMNIPFGTGRKLLRIRYTFNDGRVADVDSAVPDATDVNAWITARIPEMEASEAEAEALRILET